MILNWKNHPNFFRLPNEPFSGRSYVNPKFIAKLMKFGESLIGKERNRSTAMYQAARQLDQGWCFNYQLLWNICHFILVDYSYKTHSRHSRRSFRTKCRYSFNSSGNQRLRCLLGLHRIASNYLFFAQNFVTKFELKKSLWQSIRWQCWRFSCCFDSGHKWNLSGQKNEPHSLRPKRRWSPSNHARPSAWRAHCFAKQPSSRYVGLRV